MNILMVSYTSLIQELYHAKPRSIAKFSDVHLTVFVPPAWRELWSEGTTALEVTQDSSYRIEIAPVLFTGNLHCAFFRKKLGTLVRQLQPEIIDIEDETFNAGSAQIIYFRNRYSQSSRIVMHASQSEYKQYPPPFSWFEQYSLRNVSAFMARNQGAVDVLRRKGYKGKVEIITHGVDPSQFLWNKDSARSSLGWPHEFTVGYLGALVKHKGLDTLLHAVSQLNCRLILIGDGSEKSDLEQLSRELRCGDRLTILPPIPHREVPKYLAAMDVFVLPSRTTVNWREKFGRVLIEAMAAGIPLIGSSSGEIPNVIGDAGLIFPEGDSAALSAYLELLMDNPQERDRLSHQGLERVRTQYSWDVIATRTYNLYQEVITSS